MEKFFISQHFKLGCSCAVRIFPCLGTKLIDKRERRKDELRRDRKKGFHHDEFSTRLQSKAIFSHYFNVSYINDITSWRVGDEMLRRKNDRKESRIEMSSHETSTNSCDGRWRIWENGKREEKSISECTRVFESKFSSFYKKNLNCVADESRFFRVLIFVLCKQQRLECLHLIFMDGEK